MYNLRALGINLAVISITVCSFTCDRTCKAVLVALNFFQFGVVPDGSSLDLSMSTLLVEALPSLLTIALLVQFHSGSVRAAGGGDIGVSLLARETRGHSAIDAAVVRE
jgi:hypothetical protein